MTSLFPGILFPLLSLLSASLSSASSTGLIVSPISSLLLRSAPFRVSFFISSVALQPLSLHLFSTLDSHFKIKRQPLVFYPEPFGSGTLTQRLPNDRQNHNLICPKYSISGRIKSIFFIYQITTKLKYSHKKFKKSVKIGRKHSCLQPKSGGAVATNGEHPA